MKSLREFVRGYRGQEILDTCNGLDCTLREVIDCIKGAYTKYIHEFSIFSK
jgi:hypothetical protein